MSEKKENIYDLLVIGGASAGLSAGIYAGRRAMKTLIITKDIGGQISTTPSVENYPGIDFITGPDLGLAMQAQALKWGAEIVFDEVSKIEKRGEQDFVITTNQTTYHTRSLLLAYGKTPRNLDIPGEREYAGRGVSYCVNCDAPLFRGRTVAVVGGGSSAMEGALILSKFASKVYLVHRRDEFRGEAVLLNEIKNTANIETVLSHVPVEVMGDKMFVTGLKVVNVKTQAESTLALDGIFVEVGFIINSALIEHLVEIDKMKQVVTNNLQETSCPGVFAAGDITDTPYKQAVISASEGAKAALTAYAYLHEGKSAGVDWSAKH